MSDEELPEHQIFHILRVGDQEPIGPYSQDQLVELLNNDQIKATDFVYYPELDGWKQLSQVFDLHQEISNFADDGQDPHVVAEGFNFINSRSEPNEEVYYIAVQELPALSLTAAIRLVSPRSMIVTNHRFCVLNPKLMGAIEFEEYPLNQIVSGIKKVKSGKESGTFNIVLKNGEWVEIDKIPIAQLNRLEQLAGELAEGKAPPAEG